MTIYELKAKNEKNGGFFFSRDSLKMFGDTMKNFGVRKVTFNTVEVYRKRPVVGGTGKGAWLFNTYTGRMIA